MSSSPRIVVVMDPIGSIKPAKDTTLAGLAVPGGAKILLWTQAAMFDTTAFPYPERLRPDRTTQPYLHLGGGLHPCAGRTVNAWQIPLLVGALLDLGPRRLGPMRWAGPFPAHLPVYFKERAA